MRTYRRKDHLVQHLRGLHQLDTLPDLGAWKIPGSNITSRCGSCNERLEPWESRVDHLTTHFRQGQTMSDWQGDHGFDPAVAAHVRNVLPPYVLGAEANIQRPHTGLDCSQPTPGGASVETSTYEASSVPDFELTLSTCTTFLAWHLGQFAQRLARQGVFPTDKMFQNELRLFVYGTGDAWERTIADNPEWLAQIRQQYMHDPTKEHSYPPKPKTNTVSK
ncbi:hypothetical protein FOVG_19747 [Fusarium oxysporum f. sp. pisi HDV247]|uniref:C2H2-type domain-containing protein n=1 Tax=Fusarium oxysporum f. sp. pisi HDV247 TaxID=1080344 RepID=W9ND55_FUSOX|nr:hypothetical protein FOVG_19747 [Fusarium oxysporum f. sp. pisi HDV247]